MTTTITTASGRTKTLPSHVDVTEVVGLDEAGRIVVVQDWMDDYAFGLTICCDAWDKGMEDGIYCRACYGEKSDDAGAYYSLIDGVYAGIDRAVKLTTV